MTDQAIYQNPYRYVDEDINDDLLKEIKKAYAKGAKIQAFVTTPRGEQFWTDCRHPFWDKGVKYRIKPTTVKRELLCYFDSWKGDLRWIDPTVYTIIGKDWVRVPDEDKTIEIEETIYDRA